MKYKCLVLDHDDTVVNSTATVHYPCFVEYMKLYFPHVQMSLEEYFIKNFDPGVISLFLDTVGMTEEEMKDEEIYWKEYVRNHVPKAYPGIREIIEEQKNSGGLVCVVSHSFKDNILRDYRENCLPMPDRIFGWDDPKELRKPSPWPLYQIMEQYQLRPEEMIVVDDLKPGFDMASAAGVPFAAAGWANDIPQIERFMRENCGLYCKTVDDLKEVL